MKSFWAIVALIVIVASAGFLISYYAKQPKPGQTVLHRAPVACDACGKAYITMLGDQPAKCYYCEQQTAWRAIQCADCKAIIPMVSGKFSGESSRVCPKCGSSRLTEVSPDGLEEH